MSGEDLSPDQWFALGSVAIAIAVALCVLGIALEYRRSRR